MKILLISYGFQKLLGDWAKDLPTYRDYRKDFWFQFEDENTLLNLRHVDDPEYVRRKQRYVVMFEVNATVTPHDSTPERVSLSA